MVLPRGTAPARGEGRATGTGGWPPVRPFGCASGALERQGGDALRPPGDVPRHRGAGPTAALRPGPGDAQEPADRWHGSGSARPLPIREVAAARLARGLREAPRRAGGRLGAIRTAEEAYFSEFGVYVTAAAHPAAVPGSTKAVWNPAAGNGFNTIGWSPTGNVYYQYAVSIGAGSNEYWAQAVADIDGNGMNNAWAYVAPVPGSTTTGAADVISAGQCSNAGVYNASTGAQDLLNTVGPCDNVSGQSEF